MDYSNWQLNNGGECLGHLLRVYTLSMEGFFFEDQLNLRKNTIKNGKVK